MDDDARDAASGPAGPGQPLDSRGWSVIGWAAARGSIPDPETWEPDAGELAELSPRLGEASRRRAAFAVEASQTLLQLGLSNTFEPEALFVEPGSCLDAREQVELARGLGTGSSAAGLRRFGLGFLVPSLVRRYAATRAAEAGGMQTVESLEQTVGPNRPALLFDPLYGVALFQRDDEWFHQGLATQGWVRMAQRVPVEQRDGFLSRPADALRQGAVLARSFLGEVVAGARNADDAFAVPELIVETPEELHALVDRIRGAVEGSGTGYGLWFRGQARDHLVPDRGALVQRGLCPYSDVRDSSLVPSLYRALDGFHGSEGSYSRLLRHIGDWGISAMTILPEPTETLDLVGRPYTPRPVPARAIAESALSMSGAPHANVPGLTDPGPVSLRRVRDTDGTLLDEYVVRHHPSLSGFRQQLLLQHYGCKTAWLDLTRDVDVGLWFALHRLVGDETLLATRWDGWGADPAEWPTLFAFLLDPTADPVIDTAHVLRDSDARRPQLQACGLLGGGGSLARNYSARYVALRIRLGPALASVPLPAAEELFPGPAEDPVLARLLEHQALPGNDRLFPVYQVTGARAD